MPVHSEPSKDSLREIIDCLEPVGVIVDPPSEPIKVTGAGSMSWQERVRSTEAELQRLSTGYPLAWHGDV
jgi:hypothetical protein